MEKLLIKKEKLVKNKEKSEKKQEIIVKKRINLASHLSSAKSPSIKESTILKSKRFEKNKDEKKHESITKHKIKLPSELIAKKRMIDHITSNQNYIANMTLPNFQTEIKEKNIVFKNNNEDKKKILGKIITDFSSNKKLNNNIFDDGNQFNLINNNYYQNINTISSNDVVYNRKDVKEANELNKTITQTNNIQEIKINTFKIKNNNNKNTNSNNKSMKLILL
jgi:hypothetical protein